jgi:membrane protease YdiL (CAAX protease family)
VNTNIAIQNFNDKRWLIISAWFSILCVSDLPDIILITILGQVSQWLIYCKVGFLVIFFGFCFLWQKIRPLLPYTFVLLVFFLALIASDCVRTSVWWKGLINDTESSFFLGYLRPYLRNTGVALIVITALWIIKRRRSDFFLVRGKLNAPIEPIQFLGIRKGESWGTFGWIFALVAAIVVAIPTLTAIELSPDILSQVAPAIPAILFYAAINAFNEEILFRVTLLATLPKIIGKNHTLLINIAFFGLAHYLYGTPSGIIGFLMTGFLAWILGKSILETKGLFWAWFIHFLPDIVIFFSYAVAWGQI